LTAFQKAKVLRRIKFDGLVKSPSATLRFNFVVAEGRGGSPSRPISGNPAGCPYHLICAPSPAWGGRAFYETIKFPAEKRGAFGFCLISSFGMIKFL
jgi:hypothetical protein